jgi:Ni/Co efflux regulator RcnB
MKKLVSIMAVAAFMLSMSVTAQEPKQKAKKETAKTEKSCATAEKKSCGSEAKSGGCCASKKTTEKKAE